jgi:hypothetical protein
MPIHITISGHDIKYEDSPKLDRFLKRVQAMVDDKKATEDDLIALVYGPDNPILEQHALFPERGAVTKTVLENPVYRVLTDQLARKRFAQTGTDPAKVGAKFTLTVSEAAALKGVTQDAIRKAIRDWRLPSWKQDGEYYLEPKSLEAIELGKRGPMPEHVEPLKYSIGFDSDLNVFMRIKGPSGELSTNEAEQRGTLSRWRRVAILTGGAGKLRMVVLEPGDELATPYQFHDYAVRGKFKIVRKVNGSAEARTAWEMFKAS